MKPPLRSSLPLIAAAVSSVSAQAQSHGGKLLLMHYMPWFESPEFAGSWGFHWTGPNGAHDPNQTINGLPDIYSNYHPLIGPYDSIDEDVVECQLLQMKLAGIDGVIPDWYGLSPINDYPRIHQATQVLFDKAGDLDMRFAALFEDRTYQQRVAQGNIANSSGAIQSDLASMFQWMQTNWFSQQQYVHLDGRPLLLNFGPIYVNNAGIWNNALATLPVRPRFFALESLWQNVQADGAFMWVHPEIWTNNPGRTSEQIKAAYESRINSVTTDTSEMIPSAVPGFDDAYIDQSYPSIDHRSGSTLREGLQVSLFADDWPVVQLATWNDYTEGTMIEPTHKFGYLFLEIIQEERRSELGASFVFTADDLRLPEQLLALRRSGVADEAMLDAIAQSLADGDVAAARAGFAVIGGEFFESVPTDLAVEAGFPVTLTVEMAGGAEGFELQWLRDGVPVEAGPNVQGIQTPELSLLKPSADEVGCYSVRAELGGTVVVSDGFVLGVRRSPISFDLNNDGARNSTDLLDFLDVLWGN